MYIKLCNRFKLAVLSTVMIGYLPNVVAETSSPLDVDQHPVSPRYQSLFLDPVVPLDVELSWKERFHGNESFNAEESLPPTSRVSDNLSVGSGEEESGSGEFDTTGIVKQIKRSEGKIKIEHGPVERLGMPAMTMIFRVEKPDLLDGLEKGAEVAFNVDNTSSGFTITQLKSSSESFDTTGVIKQVKASDGKVKIEHGPIKRLGMPGMTMMFRIDDPGLLEGLEKGAEVAFNVDNTSAGFSITRLKLVEGGDSNSFDARGTVKSIRMSQGKVKIAHGPIEKLGMPGMTMLFKVKDSRSLQKLEPEMTVDFNVVNTSGGFEITRIKPVQTSARGLFAAGNGDCYRVGPFDNRSRALDVISRFQKHGVKLKLKVETKRELLGIMVLIDGHESREAALATVKALQEKGIKDYFIVNEKDKRNAISLGVFGRQENADSLKTRVAAMNFNVKSEARFGQRTSYWLEGKQLESTKSIDLLFKDEIGSGIQKISSECDV